MDTQNRHKETNSDNRRQTMGNTDKHRDTKKGNTGPGDTGGDNRRGTPTRGTKGPGVNKGTEGRGVNTRGTKLGGKEAKSRGIWGRKPHGQTAEAIGAAGDREARADGTVTSFGYSAIYFQFQ